MLTYDVGAAFDVVAGLMTYWSARFKGAETDVMLHS